MNSPNKSLIGKVAPCKFRFDGVLGYVKLSAVMDNGNDLGLNGLTGSRSCNDSIWDGSEDGLPIIRSIF